MDLNPCQPLLWRRSWHAKQHCYIRGSMYHVSYKLSAWLFLWSLIRVIVILCTSFPWLCMCLTKLLRIYDSDDGCSYRVSWWYAFKTVYHSSIQTTAHRADCYPGYKRWAILTRGPWESDHGAAESQWWRYTTGASWWDGNRCVGYILRNNSELPSVNCPWWGTCQLKLISSLTNWCYWRRRDLHHSCM